MHYPKEKLYLSAQTAGSVISSRSPAAMMVPTKASIPPNWQTTILFFWLLQVRLDKIPAEQVTMLTSLLPSRPTKPLKKNFLKKNIVLILMKNFVFAILRKRKLFLWNFSNLASNVPCCLILFQHRKDFSMSRDNFVPNVC